MSVQFPAWIIHSGLPRYLAEMTGGSAAWLLFKTVVELDCRRAEPARVDVSVADLAKMTGIDDTEVLRLFHTFRDAKLARLYIPEDEDENALIELLQPIATPIPHSEVLKQFVADPAVNIHRYCDCPEAQPLDAHDETLQEIVDLYLSVCGFQINAFILDRLKNLRHSANLDEIRWAFRKAEQNNSRSLDFVIRLACKLKDKRIKNR